METIVSTDSTWPGVDTLGKSFLDESNTLPQSDNLIGNKYILNSLTQSLNIFFKSSDCLIIDNNQKIDKYRITSLCVDIYLIDFVDKCSSITIILDLNRSQFISITGRLPSIETIDASIYRRAKANKELTGVNVDFQIGTIDCKYDSSMITIVETRDLIGMCNRYIYSTTTIYDHIYLNDQYFNWNCIDGIEKNLTDTDRCHYYRIVDGVYLIVWREKIIPTLGVTLIDLVKMKTDGKIFGYAETESGEFETFSNFPIGAIVMRLANLPYE